MLHRSLPIIALTLFAAAAVAQPQPKPANPPPAPAPAENQPESGARSRATDEMVTDAMKAESARLWDQAEQAFKSKNYTLAAQSYTQLTTTYRNFLTPAQVTQADANLKTSRELAPAKPDQPQGAQPTPQDGAPAQPEHNEPKWITDYTPPERALSGDDEIDGLVGLLSGSFATDPKAQTETSPAVSWNAAPVRVDGLKNAIYFEVARTDDLANPYRQGVLSVFRRRGELRIRVLDFGASAIKDAVVGLWAAPEAFPEFSVEKLSPNVDIPILRIADGSGYSGATPRPVPTVRGGAVEMTSSIKITADGILTSDTGFDSNGKEVWRPDQPAGVLFLHAVPPAAARRRDDGLITIDLARGDTNTPALEAGTQIALHFSQYLADGTKLDTSRVRAPVQTRVPVGSMKGLDDGLMGMHKGTRRRIVIPPALGFGKEARGTIPANSTVIFDIESLWQQPPAPPPSPLLDPNSNNPTPPAAPVPPAPAPAGPPRGGH